MVDLSQITIRASDIYKAGICGSGARGFWRERGWAWSDFLTNGISAQTLWDTGDGYARLVVRRKLAREGLSDG